MACSRVAPHISTLARRLAHTAGRRGSPNSLQRSLLSSCTQRMPAGLPEGMPGIGEEIDGAMQQAPQPLRQFIGGRPPRGAGSSNPPGNPPDNPPDNPVVLVCSFANVAT